MNDLELLLAAAKAARLDAWRGNGWQSDKMFIGATTHSSGLISGVEWDPLVNDGDSAWLRRSCRIVVQWFPTDVAAMHFGGDGRGRSWAEPYGDDPAAAERRAVVRAAAAIGAQMP